MPVRARTRSAMRRPASASACASGMPTSTPPASVLCGTASERIFATTG